ncbi:hypothetical protein CEXT_736691 [Caerostris extrusa]|uniref:Uncharacterized protein n=1 Tax=Caerostris extrusa TaxID=172846 RepID=A0AAV4N2M9_CAEEX|nr:hypothetical protein CEXT_736691 [Caerostris extrusa]
MKHNIYRKYSTAISAILPTTTFPKSANAKQEQVLFSNAQLSPQFCMNPTEMVALLYSYCTIFIENPAAITAILATVSFPKSAIVKQQHDQFSNAQLSPQFCMNPTEMVALLYSYW